MGVRVGPPAEVVGRLRGDRKRYDQPAEALAYARARRVPGNRALPVERYGEAREHMRGMARYELSGGLRLPPESEEIPAKRPLPGRWRPLGPDNAGGVTRALLLHPDLGSNGVLYAAGMAGVWKSIDAGASWQPLDGVPAHLPVNALAMDPRNPDVLYAGTGEGFFEVDGFPGMGIWKSTDGGATWTHLRATAGSEFAYVNDLAVSPNDSGQLYAATRTGHRQKARDPSPGEIGCYPQKDGSRNPGNFL